MPGSPRQTPDGRVILDLQHDAPEDRDPVTDRALRQFAPFVDACATVLPAGNHQHSHARLGLFVFLLGAADRLWQRGRLDDASFPALADRLLRMQGVAPEVASTIATTVPQLRDVPAARDMLTEGAAAMDGWLDSHDSNSLMRLPELLNRWRDKAGFDD